MCRFVNGLWVTAYCNIQQYYLCIVSLPRRISHQRVHLYLLVPTKPRIYVDSYSLHKYIIMLPVILPTNDSSTAGLGRRTGRGCCGPCNGRRRERGSAGSGGAAELRHAHRPGAVGLQAHYARHPQARVEGAAAPPSHGRSLHPQAPL